MTAPTLDADALIAELADKLNDMVWRFKMCARMNGTEDEYIEIAVKPHRDALARVDAYLKGKGQAAAPDMYEAATSLLACAGKAEHWTEDERKGAGYLRAALARARGEQP